MESGAYSLEAIAGDLTGKLGEIGPKRTCLQFKPPVRV